MSPAGSGSAPTVFFLSDYGLDDGFVGICHAVVRRLAPATAVLDLTHGITPFDVAGGAEALARAVPHLGPGTVLAVVDPGVGTKRRAVALEVAGAGPRWFVGPDNGLLVTGAERAGGIVAAWSLRRPPGSAVTFDGRDVFSPAAAVLCVGGDPADLGVPVDPRGLARLPAYVCERAGATVRVSVTWVDRFGNVQLAAESGVLAPGADALVVDIGPHEPGRRRAARRVRAFAELAPGELGVVVDAEGRLTLCLREGSAAALTGARAGDVVEVSW